MWNLVTIDAILSIIYASFNICKLDLKMPLRALQCHRDHQKGASLHAYTSYDVMLVKMGPRVRGQRGSQNKVKKEENYILTNRNMFRVRRDHPRRCSAAKICM